MPLSVPGDEVVAVQGKLDGIKTRYAEMVAMSRGVCGDLERVLGLSTQLHAAHRELATWLEPAEAEVASFAALDPVGQELSQAQDRQTVGCLECVCVCVCVFVFVYVCVCVCVCVCMCVCHCRMPMMFFLY